MNAAEMLRGRGCDFQPDPNDVCWWFLEVGDGSVASIFNHVRDQFSWMVYAKGLPGGRCKTLDEAKAAAWACLAQHKPHELNVEE